MRLVLIVVLLVAGAAALFATGAVGDHTPHSAVVAKEFAVALREHNVDAAMALIDDSAKGPSPTEPSTTDRALRFVRFLDGQTDEVQLTSEFFVNGDRVGWLMVYQTPSSGAQSGRVVEAWHEVTVSGNRIVGFSLTPTAESASRAFALARFRTADTQTRAQPVPTTLGRDQMMAQALADGAVVVSPATPAGPSPLPALAAGLSALLVPFGAAQLMGSRRTTYRVQPRLRGHLIEGLKPMVERRAPSAGGPLATSR